MTEVEKLKAWFEQEKKKGLIDIKFDGGLGMEMSGRKPTLEEACKDVNGLLNGPWVPITAEMLGEARERFAGEVNEILAAPDVEDEELF